MHIPKKFQQDDSAKLEGLIRDYPFATLVTYSKQGVEANHLPVILTEIGDKKVLQAHIAKANPLWKTVDDKSNVLVIFKGPDCYISPNNYPTKTETGRAVPTWNYVAVHVRGRMSYIQDPGVIKNMIDDLTTRHEAEQDAPWSTSDAPNGYIEKMLTAIVGLEIEISSITGMWKLSQNQPDTNISGVIAGLGSEGNHQQKAVAELVKEHAGKVSKG
ncbi:MAG: transcriptional regulator [Motiliproteus sp.]